MNTTTRYGILNILGTSVLCGVLVFPLDLLISLRSHSAGIGPAVWLALRSCGLMVLVVALGSGVFFLLLKVLARITPYRIEESLRQALFVGWGIFVMLFFWIFDRFYYKFEALVVIEFLGGAAAVLAARIAYAFLRSGDRFQRLARRGPRLVIIGAVLAGVIFGISFPGTGARPAPRDTHAKAGRSDGPNVLLIVMDTVRADHLSLYGYPRKTTPFLERLAEDASVFTHAYAAAPWTLPSHASIFTGLYPSRHNTHAEHLWLDNSYRTLAEMLSDDGYQTVSFSNNDYISSYHNMIQGFERTWGKGTWADEIRMPDRSFGGSVLSTLRWVRDQIRTRILVKVMENPADLFDCPNAGVTNQAVSEWLNRERDKSRPFFVFINYMDAHFPYNPDNETARLFLDEKDVKQSHRLSLRFPPIEYMLDMSKGGYTEADIRIMNGLYDACLRYLDGEIEKLLTQMKALGIYDNTLIILTSDHGEYFGTRNRLAHGLGLHDELLHIPLIARYPSRFKAGARYDTVVTHIDIPETILSCAKIQERPKKRMPAQVLYAPTDSFRPYVYGEFRYPAHLLVNASLREDNSGLFVEQKTIHSSTHQWIWKSRGDPEFYNVAEDPLEATDLYAKGLEKETSRIMSGRLNDWMKSLPVPGAGVPQVSEAPQKQDRELIDRLRALGYVN